MLPIHTYVVQIVYTLDSSHLRRYLVDANRLTIQSNLIHNLDCIVGILFSQKLYEAIALMCLCHSVLW